jgi:SAM-dependent methyltransferase
VSANEAMIEFWNGPGADRWVGEQARYDAMLDPLTAPLVELVGREPESTLLDVGCGCGSLSLSLAGGRHGQGTVTGIDLSAPMLDLARRRATAAGIDHVDFVLGDAQSHAFDVEAYDTVVSRFGVMFFDDPVAAFSNLARATRRDGRLRCVVWQSALDNEWVTVPFSIASRFIEIPPPDDSPGPWALADPDRVRGILTDAGWRLDEVDAIDGHLAVGGQSSYAAAVEFAVDQGPMARMLAEADQPTVDTIRAAFDEELAPFYDGEALRLRYAAWLVEATRP